MGGILISSFLCVFIFIVFLNIGIKEVSGFIITNAIIVIMSVFGLFRKAKRYYSLDKIYCTFVLFFFGVVPYKDYIENNIYWTDVSVSHNDMFITNLVIIISLIFYYLGVHFAENKYFGYSKFFPKRELVIKKRNLALFFILLISISSCLLILVYNDFKVAAVLLRGVQGNSSGQISFLINSYLIKPIPFLCLMVFVSLFKIRKHKIYFIIILGLAVFFVAPTSTARFLAAALYLSFFILATNFLNRKYVFQLITILGIMLVLPMLDIFRYWKLEGDNKIKYNLDFLSTGHFDAYQNLSRVIELDIVTWGKQFIGVISFFIPRSIFPDKPLGSGSLLAEADNLFFDNISFPLLAEFYVNFSIIGCIVFSSVLGFFVTKFDRKYWDNTVSSNNAFYGLYALSLGLFLFVLRGDLLSSFAYSLTILITYYLIFSFVKKSNC